MGHSVCGLSNSKSKNLNKRGEKKKKTQNLQQNPNLIDQSMTKLNQLSAVRAVEDDATSNWRAVDQWRRWSLQTKGDGSCLICEGSVRVRESDLKKKEREHELNL